LLKKQVEVLSGNLQWFAGISLVQNNKQTDLQGKRGLLFK
jgi:hypothetical protein